MQTIYADTTISMSEFKKNPAAVLREAGNRPVAVLNHNRAAFYMVGRLSWRQCSKHLVTGSCIPWCAHV
jgi:PHD/YefM family antitoxin component YafN of YafNO toxin-antitoxin module